MTFRWNNGVAVVGYLFMQDAYGIQLSWGRRDLLGDVVEPGCSLFSDHKTWIIVYRDTIRKLIDSTKVKR